MLRYFANELELRSQLNSIKQFFLVSLKISYKYDFCCVIVVQFLIKVLLNCFSKLHFEARIFIVLFFLFHFNGLIESV